MNIAKNRNMQTQTKTRPLVLNVGLGKAAMQSSTAGHGSAQKAVDGSTSPYFQASTCTMTDVEHSPWWYVNLLEPYLVQIVRIDFGTACCGKCAPRLLPPCPGWRASQRATRSGSLARSPASQWPRLMDQCKDGIADCCRLIGSLSLSRFFSSAR